MEKLCPLSWEWPSVCCAKPNWRLRALQYGPPCKQTTFLHWLSNFLCRAWLIFITNKGINRLMLASHLEVGCPRTWRLSTPNPGSKTQKPALPATKPWALPAIPTIPDKIVGTRNKFSPPLTLNVDNLVIFALFVGKNAIFFNID